MWSRPSTAGNVYPNLYVLLIAPPGVGKSVPLSKAEMMLRAIPTLKVAPSSLTTASLIDSVNAAHNRYLPPPGPMEYNSLQVVSSELGVFLPAYDAAFMNTLTKLYDGEFYEERRRTGKTNHVRIESPQLSILGGSTPSYLNSFLPDGAWDQGFTSRTILVYHGQASTPVLFGEEIKGNEQIWADLVHDLTAIANLGGQMVWEKEAQNAIQRWIDDGYKPKPTHAKLNHYLPRRPIHLIKLSMIAAVADSNTLTVRKDHFYNALSWLLEVEALIPEIFNSVGVTDESHAVNDLIYRVQQQFEKTKRGVSESFLYKFLQDRIPSYAIPKVIEVMVKSHKLAIVLENGIPRYRPVSPTADS